MPNDRTAEHNSSGGAQLTRFELPFVGRPAERDHIDGLLRDAAVGRGRPLFVAGEAGVGKSRLITEFLQVADSHGADVSPRGKPRLDIGAECEEMTSVIKSNHLAGELATEVRPLRSAPTE